VKVRAPASTANVGPGFDCAAIALDLWDELEVTQDGTTVSGSVTQSLFEQAFAKLAPVDGLRFTVTRRIPRNGGLGSSAAEIALGLAAGAIAAGRDAGPEELLALGLDLEGHPDNLAAALAGGVCLTWGGRIERIAERAPATPVVLVPRAAKTSTRESRAALPREIPHADAAFTAGRAALLGAALASGSLELFAEALDDRLHTPYREAGAPLLTAVRADPPRGMIGATLSGSGPSVVVWSDNSETTATELRARFPEADVLPLAVTPKGAGPA
jgi:homoserine kinase